jgi:hypothetical protein
METCSLRVAEDTTTIEKTTRLSLPAGSFLFGAYPRSARQTPTITALTASSRPSSATASAITPPLPWRAWCRRCSTSRSCLRPAGSRSCRPGTRPSRPRKRRDLRLAVFELVLAVRELPAQPCGPGGLRRGLLGRCLLGSRCLGGGCLGRSRLRRLLPCRVALAGRSHLLPGFAKVCHRGAVRVLSHVCHPLPRLAHCLPLPASLGVTERHRHFAMGDLTGSSVVFHTFAEQPRGWHRAWEGEAGANCGSARKRRGRRMPVSLPP